MDQIVDWDTERDERASPQRTIWRQVGADDFEFMTSESSREQDENAT
ncbi:hypothetical protein [Phenylobacterium soli]|nr:hypothetical protein [Phenylobacterium soli]